MRTLLKHYWPEIKRYRWLAAAMIAAETCVAFGEMAWPYLVRRFTDIVTQSPNEAAVTEIFGIFGYLIGLFVVIWLAHRMTEFATVAFETQAMRDMENRAFAALHKHSIRFFKNTFAGSLVKKVDRFTRAFERLTDIFCYELYQKLLTVLLVFGIFCYERPWLGLAFAIWAILFLGGNYVFVVWKLKYNLANAEADSAVSATIADSVSNYASVKTFAGETFEEQHFKEVSEDRYKKRRFVWTLNSWSNFVQGASMIIFEMFVYYMMIQWWRAGNLTAGDVVFIQSYFIMLFRSLWEFGRHLNDVFESTADAQEMIDIFEEDIEVQDTADAVSLQVEQGSIQFENIHFTFETDQKHLFKDFSLQVPAGEKIALVGPSGAGKSSLVNLLFRFYDVEQGAISIDGQNIAQVTKESLRKSISLVPQAPEMFHRTIAENIAYGKKGASQEEVIAAAKHAHADEFIEKFTQGYETLVGERGVKLSGGERQRIAIARAFLENAPILVLDEATSALDSVTEKSIQDAMFKLMEGKTSIVIAHRLSTILSMDRIVVIDDAKIVEDGSHEELLAKKGLYATLWEHQAGGFIGE